MAQAQDWQQLRKILEDEQVVLHDLLSLLGDEYRCLRTVNHPGLVTLTKKKETLMARLPGFEHRRCALFLSLTGKSLPPDLPSLTSILAEHVSSPDLATLQMFEGLWRVAKEIVIQGRKNGEMIHRGLNTVREALRLLYTGIGNEPVYGDEGVLQFPRVTSSMIVEG
jgi:flagellar biosynthesis/type III secretory pathway chaperone